MSSSRIREYGAGIFAIVIGALASHFSRDYDVGSLRSVGPGFFPFYLGLLMTAVGVMIVATAHMRTDAAVNQSTSGDVTDMAPDWRGWGFIIGGVAAFIVLAEFVGFLPATFFSVLISALADRTTSLKSAAILAAGVTVFGLTLFSKFLSINIPLIRTF